MANSVVEKEHLEKIQQALGDNKKIKKLSLVRMPPGSDAEKINQVLQGIPELKEFHLSSVEFHGSQHPPTITDDICMDAHGNILDPCPH